MSVGFVPVQWNRHKRTYDLIMAGGIITYLVIFIAATVALGAAQIPSPPILLMRALGSCAIVLLHIILFIGPLARLWSGAAPLLYNRRHMGVAAFFIALVHGIVVIGFYHGFGTLSPIVSILGINPNFFSIHGFPFELPGLLALIIMLLLAATSHDFWQKVLTPTTWKYLHMLVYIAYALLIAHVILGPLQAGQGYTGSLLLLCGATVLAALHVAAALKEHRRDRGVRPEDGWIDAGLATEIPRTRAKVISAQGEERIAVFRDGDSISAVTNLCAHQGGPLGEGKVIDGCVTCPWHGWQYRASDGCSPPPFTEKIVTYPVRIVAGRVKVNQHGLAAGTLSPPAIIPGELF